MKSKTLLILLSIVIIFELFSATSWAAKPKLSEAEKAMKAAKEEARFPIGCKPVGYQQYLKVLSIFPGREGALQSLYFIYNNLDQTISLYHMRDEDSEYTTRMNHTIGPKQWAALATGEPLVQFVCTLGDGKADYGKIIDCANTVKVCEYVHVKFGMNNKGNFWIADGTTRNGAVNEVVHYGIIPGV